MYKRCQKHFHDVTEKRPGYKTPEEFKPSAQADFGTKRKALIFYYTELAMEYKRKHTYLVGTQRLSKGAYGNDRLYEYSGGAWMLRTSIPMRIWPASRTACTGYLTGQGWSIRRNTISRFV